MVGLLAVLAFFGALAVVAGGLAWLGSRLRRRGVGSDVMGPFEEIWHPAAHRALAGEIAADGLIVSEYAPGIEPAPWRFPARNRVGIAGTLANLKQAAEADASKELS